MRSNGFRTTHEERVGVVVRDSRNLMEGFRFREIPSLEEGSEIAAEIRSNFIAEAPSLVIAESLIEQNGWGIDYWRFGVAGMRSPMGAQLSPVANEHRFKFLVNTDYLVEESSDNMAAGLIGHEIGHTFFYGDTLPPTPRHGIPLIPVTPEHKQKAADLERFCDHFSLHLTGVTLPTEVTK